MHAGVYSLYCALHSVKVMVYSVLFGMTQKLVFKRGNLVGDDHPMPAIAEVTLSLTCSFPSSIALIVDEPGKYLNCSSQTLHSI